MWSEEVRVSKIGSLFSGIGGFSLAAKWMGWETSWFSEIDSYASKVLNKRWPRVKNLGDITEDKFYPPVDLLCGGFPCQDISCAGLGEGLKGKRSSLWFHFAKVIKDINPFWVVIENTTNLRNKGLNIVLQNLSSLGYDAEWHCIPASSFGALHRRDRIWIIAYPRGTADGPVVGHSNRKPLHSLQLRGGKEGSREATPEGEMDSLDTSLRDQPKDFWSSEPRVGRVVNGVPNHLDRLKCLGNSLVPVIPYYIFSEIDLWVKKNKNV